jgi:hypothetical protein
MDHLQPFGAKVFYRNYDVKNKLRPRYLDGRLLGYQPGTTHYRLLDATGTKTIESWDVKFSREEVDTTAPGQNKVAPRPTLRTQSQWELESDVEDIGEDDGEDEEAPPAEVPRPADPEVYQSKPSTGATISRMGI